MIWKEGSQRPWLKKYPYNNSMLILLIIFFLLWLIATLKSVLFWVYLWQLKEYHVFRFLDHFKTAKGQTLLLGKLRIIKIFFVCLFLFNPLAPFIFIGLIYVVESGKTALDFWKKKMLKPVFTAKTIVMSFMAVFLEIVFAGLAFWKIQGEAWLSVLFFPVFLAIADLLTPFIISLLVIFLKPITNFFVRKKLKQAASKLEKFSKLTVVGISGSYGKTSTKEFLSEILSEKYSVLKTKKNINAEIGIAKTILEELDEKHDILIAEIGAYEKGKIKQVCKAIKPKMGILTGINNQHLATFRSQENIAKAKFEIIESLPQNGIAIINQDSQYVREGIKSREAEIKKKNISVDNIDCTIVQNMLVEKESVSFEIDGHGFKINVLGRHNVNNFLMAVFAARRLGMSLEEISQAALRIRPVGITLEKKENQTIINSSYSANLTGVLADLDYLNIYKGKKAIIMPCLIELGKDSRTSHELIAKKISQVCDFAVITSEECFEEINKECKAVLLQDSEKIAEKVKGFDAVLLEGRISKEIIQKIIKRAA